MAFVIGIVLYGNTYLPQIRDLLHHGGLNSLGLGSAK